MALPIFPGRHQPSIVGRNELNYRVRNGNGWTLALINTNCVEAKSISLRFRLPVKTTLHFFASPLPFTNATLVCEWSPWGLSAPSKPNNATRLFSGRLLIRRSSPRAISTSQLHTLLRFHLLPINQIVFLGPYLMKSERSHLRGSFTLRCFQRLSRPYIATQLCRWHDNWCTRGTSIPVLSY